MEAVERETGILTEVDSYDWITFLPMSDGGGSCNRYYGKLNTDKMKIRGVMARKGDTPEYVNRNQGGDHKGDHNWNPNDSNNGKQGG